MMKVDVHGSCVSYNLIKKNDGIGFQWKLEGVESNLYFSHVNIAGSVLKPISLIPSKEDFLDEGWAKSASERAHNIRNMITDMSKDVILQLLRSDAEWLMVDFYDFARIQWACDDSCYTHVVDLKSVAPEYYSKVEGVTEGYFRWMDTPTFLWYPLVDRYFEQVLPKYGSHIILNRTYLNQYCLMEDGSITEISPNYAYQGSFEDNEKIRRLEDYVISKYNLKTIDVSKYFFADYATGQDVLSVHYEGGYYMQGARILQAILNGEGDVRADLMDMDGLRYKVSKGASLQPQFQAFYFSKSPWHYDMLLDGFFAALAPEEMAKYKWAILSTYEWFYDHKQDFDRSDMQDQEKQKVLIRKFIEFADKN